ncbi:protein P21-like [Cucurbita moschata]|uniref:Protein P21-like n=1 Tax=Cucurbita moschata TaxID=3662 RepID=A0A6J1E344_CUCMO|nr:protein P21-like [Cucurbita moschata]
METKMKMIIMNICFLFSLLSFCSHTHAAIFEIRNNCDFTVWAAAVPGGGQQLNQTDVWTLEVKPDVTNARIWARTNCNFDASGRGRCETGDCGGLLHCQAYGTPPTTLAEYISYQFDILNLDIGDISLTDGFNVPIEFSPTSSECTGGNISCKADINRQCPKELKAPGGCNNPCTVFGGDRYCCTARDSSCGSTGYSRFFKNMCPYAYSYPKDIAPVVFTCPGGTNYNYTVIFCP